MKIKHVILAAGTFRRFIPPFPPIWPTQTDIPEWVAVSASVYHSKSYGRIRNSIKNHAL